MPLDPDCSGLRIEKARSHATVTLVNGTTAFGCFFVAGASLRTAGPERVSDVLNDESEFFPFEIHDDGPARTVMFNRSHVVMVMLADPEARRDPGYELATARHVSVRLSSGHRLVGAIRIYRPEGRDRLSDWARVPDRFRYVESGDATIIVNVGHVIELSEAAQ